MLTITSCRALNEEAREEVVRAAYAFRDNADLRRLRAALDALDAVEGRNHVPASEAAQAPATPGGRP